MPETVVLNAGSHTVPIVHNQLRHVTRLLQAGDELIAVRLIRLCILPLSTDRDIELSKLTQ